MNRPMVPLAVSYIIGVILGRYFISADAVYLLAALAALLAAAYIFYARTRRYEWFIVLPAAVLGVFMVNLQSDELFEAIDGKAAEVSGVVSEVRLTDYGYQIITLNASEITVEGRAYKYSRKVSVRAKEPYALHYGQAAKAYGTAERLDFRRNPGGFDESAYMWTRGFGGKLAADRIEPGRMERLTFYNANEAAESIKKTLSSKLPPDMAGFMSAIVLGDRTELSDEVNESFRKAGIAHMLTISGLQLSLAAMLAFELLGFIGLKLRGRAFATIIALWAYCAFTGSAVSTVRASLMMSIIMLGYILYRKAEVFSSLALAAFIILLWQPLFLWDAGFLLSFSAVLGMGILTPALQPSMKIFDIGGFRPSGYIAATIAATISTLPVGAYFFYSVSAAGLLVNLLIAPFITILVVLGFAFVFFGAFFIAELLASAVFTILTYYFAIAKLFGNLPFSYLTVGQPKLYNIAVYYAVVAIIMLCIMNRRAKHSDESAAPVISVSRLRIVSVVVCIIFLCLNAPSFFPKESLEIAFLDVKQGDASILHLPGNVNIMLDGGGNMLQEIGDNTGVRVIDPYLRYRGITKLDAVFLTHPDIDHAAGVIETMGLIRVKRLFISDVNMNNEVLDMVLAAAETNGVPVSRIKSGYRSDVNGVRIECVYPFNSNTPKDINNASLVLKVTHGANTFLFTGDIESPDEQKILLSGADIDSDVLKVPHHGSDTSSSDEFVSAVSPEYALVGTAKNNYYGHPTKDVSETYKRNKAVLYNTAVEGAVLLNSDGKTIRIHTMRGEAGRWNG